MQSRQWIDAIRAWIGREGESIVCIVCIICIICSGRQFHHWPLSLNFSSLHWLGVILRFLADHVCLYRLQRYGCFYIFRQLFIFSLSSQDRSPYDEPWRKRCSLMMIISPTMLIFIFISQVLGFYHHLQCPINILNSVVPVLKARCLWRQLRTS